MGKTSDFDCRFYVGGIWITGWYCCYYWEVDKMSKVSCTVEAPERLKRSAHIKLIAMMDDVIATNELLLVKAKKEREAAIREFIETYNECPHCGSVLKFYHHSGITRITCQKKCKGWSPLMAMEHRQASGEV